MDHSHPYPGYFLDDGDRRPLGELNGNAHVNSLSALPLRGPPAQFDMSVGRGESQKAVGQTHFLGAAALLPQCEPSESLKVQHGMSKTSWHKGGMNPFYSHEQFRQYRSRQSQKEEKESQKWPPILEDPFLDGKPTVFRLDLVPSPCFLIFFDSDMTS